MSQWNASQTINEQADFMYKGYQEEQVYARQEDGPLQGGTERVSQGEKVYAPRQTSANMLRFALTMAALATLLLIALFCLLSGAGEAAWIGFGIASFGIFLLVAVALDKIR